MPMIHERRSRGQDAYHRPDDLNSHRSQHFFGCNIERTTNANYLEMRESVFWLVPWNLSVPATTKMLQLAGMEEAGSLQCSVLATLMA